MEFPYPLLVCDVGGTNVRMGFWPVAGAEPILLPTRRTADFPDFTGCLDEAISGIGERPRSILACGAGPVTGRQIRLTNAAWTLEGPQTAYRLGLSQGLLLNDFEAQALSLPVHRPEWLRPVGQALSAGEGPRIILGPGTGLGVAALIKDGTRYLSLASEAAHTEFAPENETEWAIWQAAERAHGRITAEAMVSGPGLVRLHKARAKIFGFSADLAGGPALVAAAKIEPSGPAGDTLRHFWKLVARLSGDLALTFGARGGVTLSGGILPQITDFLDPENFRQTFEAKAPMGDLLRKISVQLLEAENAALFGMAAIAARPQNYLIDYEARAWR